MLAGTRRSSSASRLGCTRRFEPGTERGLSDFRRKGLLNQDSIAGFFLVGRSNLRLPESWCGKPLGSCPDAWRQNVAGVPPSRLQSGAEPNSICGNFFRVPSPEEAQQTSPGQRPGNRKLVRSFKPCKGATTVRATCL